MIVQYCLALKRGVVLKKSNRIKNAWKILVPEKYSTEPYIIKTSPVVLGCSSQCDIVINDPSVSESHIQFVLINKGKFIEIYNLAQGDGDAVRTLLNGEEVDKTRIKAQHDKFFTLKAGDVHLRLIYAPLKEEASLKKRGAPKEREVQWFFLHKGRQHGPVNRSSLIKAACEGVLLPMDDVWHSGLDHRIKAFEMPELFDPKLDTAAVFKNDIRDTPDFGASFPRNAFNLPGADDTGRLRCPYCWHSYHVDELLYISRHPDLAGDPVLGSEARQRFLPRDFEPVRRALDNRGEVCSEMACPRCHLRIPTPFLDTDPLFFSIIGTPGSGKSYYLASSTWILRKILPRYFGLNFEDVDNVTNQWLNEYEEKLFFPVDDVDYRAIEKTQIEASNLSRQVKINDITMLLPLPAIFTLLSKSISRSNNTGTMPSGGVPPCGMDREKEETFKESNGEFPPLCRTLTVYDNAGEHFQTGQDVIQKPGTLHMLHAHGFLFLFDPTADPRFNGVINEALKGSIVQTVYQQQKILIETIDRIRKHSGLNVTERFEKPVVVGLSKADLLSDYFSRKGVQFKGKPLKWLIKGEAAALDMNAVKGVSSFIRELFYGLVPEYVNTIEAFAGNVIYLPVSAVGHHPDEKGVNPRDIHPMWVEVPFLYILSETGHIPAI